MKKMNFNEIDAEIINKLNIISKLIGISKFNLNTLEIINDNITVKGCSREGDVDIDAYMNSSVIKVNVTNGNLSVNIFKLSNDVAIMIVCVSNKVVNKTLYKIEKCDLFGELKQINEEEYTLKLEKINKNN